MKNRDFKEFFPSAIVHVYNRGDNKEEVFRDEQDFKAFLFRLGLGLGFDQDELNNNILTSAPYSRIRITNAEKGYFLLHAFCLMKNHFHLLIEQCQDISISKLILKVCTSYSKFVNKKYGRVGHIFQDSFKAVTIKSDPQLMWILSYMHTNPVKDGIVKHPGEYQWSSYNDYKIGRGLPIVHTDFLKESFKNNDFNTEDLVSKGTFDMFEMD